MQTKVSMLASDLAKGSFQVCAVGPDGSVLSNRVMSRRGWRHDWPSRRRAWWRWEVCTTSHHWGRVAQADGHEARLVPAAYVKSVVKR
ncbi:MAG: hypothetical protein AAF366_15955 [Pseudomonadota bacterium]